MTTHKMLFNTGVQRHNHLNKKGELIVNPHEVWKGGLLHIAYYLEEKPAEDLKLDYLCGEEYLKVMPDYQVAIKIVGGGMLSEYAIFTKPAK